MIKLSSTLILNHVKNFGFGKLQLRHNSYFGMKGGNLENVNQDVDKIAQGWYMHERDLYFNMIV